MKYVLLYCLSYLWICQSKGENSPIELEELRIESIVLETNPGFITLQEKIVNIHTAFQVKSELLMKDASLQIRKIEEAAKRQREDTQRDIIEEEKITIEETHFKDVEFLVKHCSSKQFEVTEIMLQNAMGGIRTCVGLAKKKTDVQKVLFEDIQEKLILTEDELKKLQNKCNENNKIKDKENCLFERLYMSNGPVVNLYLRKIEAEHGLKDGGEALEEMKNSLIECSEIVQQNMREDMQNIVNNFKICCANVVSSTKVLLKLIPHKN